MSSPCHTTSCDGAEPPFTRGGNFPISRSLGSIESLPISPSGTFICTSSVMRAPISSRSVTPSASDMRFMEPNRLIATGYAEREPSRRITCSNRSAGPPFALFMTRSAISQISRWARTGCATRTSSPMESMRAMKSEMLSMLMRRARRSAARRCRTSAAPTPRVRSPHRACAPRANRRRGNCPQSQGDIDRRCDDR